MTSQIATADFNNPIVDVPNVPNVGAIGDLQLHTLGSLLGDKEYQWRVRGKAASGLVGDFASQRFIVDLINPSVPTLLAPANGITTGNNAQTFDWSDVVDTSGVTYRIQLAVGITGGLTQSEFTVGQPLDDGVYLWSVQAEDGAGKVSGFTDPFTLTIDTTPPSPPRPRVSLRKCVAK